MTSPRHLSRFTDPEPSHEAADEHVRSGRNAQQRHDVLRAIRQYPGRTGRELADESGLDYHLIQRRLCELQRDGKIIRAQTDVRCTITGRNTLRQYPADAPKDPAPPGSGGVSNAASAGDSPKRPIPSGRDGQRAPSGEQGDLF